MSNKLDINWRAAEVGEIVLKTEDFTLKVGVAAYDTAVKGHKAYLLVYRPSGIVLAEGTDIAYSVRRTLMEQTVLDMTREDPMRGLREGDYVDLSQVKAAGRA